MSFKDLKKSRTNSMDKLIKAAEKVGGSGDKKSFVDDAEWKVSRDKAGNAYAVIRFLPAAEGEDIPWVQYWDHGFQGPGGKWYIEKSLTSIGKQDPVSEHNSLLWNTGRDEDKETARRQKRRLHYASNIYVVSDPANPQNEGKIFKYVYGKKIFDMIMDVMQPEFPDDAPMNPFDLWEGAEFKIKVRKVDGWVNYGSSVFAAPSEFLDGDEVALEEVFNKLYKLGDYVDPANYKSYAELETKMKQVLGQTAVPMTTAESIELDEPKEAPVLKAKAENETANVVKSSDDEDTMSYFSNLANS